MSARSPSSPGDWPWRARNSSGRLVGRPRRRMDRRLIGLVFGGTGALLGWLSGRGLARAFVTVAMRVLIGIGAADLIIGGLAFFQDQPYAVWYPLALTGVISQAVLPVVLRQVTRQYANRELQRIKAADTLRS